MAEYLGDALGEPAPLHNLLLDHTDGCPPQCQHRQWVERKQSREVSTDG